MKKTLLLVVVVCFSLGVLLSAGCAKKAASVSEAIESSKALKTVQEQANYMISQAQAFYNSKDFQQAIETAQYVLSNLDKNSQGAKDLIEKAKAQLKAAAEKAVGDASKKLFGK